MAGLLSLPVELIQTIGEDLGPAKKQLRLVCNQLSLAIEPLILSHVVIDLSSRRRMSTVNAQLSLLASKEYRSTCFIRELFIRSLTSSRESHHHCAQMAFINGRWDAVRKHEVTQADRHEESVLNKSLEDAISNMVNLQVVRWSTTSNDSTWTTLAVINGLSRSKSLSYLNLHLAFGFDASNLRLDLLRDLKRIVISGSCQFFHQHVVKHLGECVAQSPEIASINIDRNLWCEDSDIPTLHSLLNNAAPLQLEHLGLHGWYTRFDDVTLPHLRSLKSLSLTNNNNSPKPGHPFSSSAAELWYTLRANKIYLERISTDAVDAALVEYLASYSGLTRLYLKNVTASDRQSSDQLAELFFNSALIQHSSTLEDLYVSPRYEGKWCFGEDIARNIIRCSRLQYLKVAVISSEVDPSRGGNIINKLIDMVARHLKALKNLSITTAQLESFRGSLHATALKEHFSFTTNVIAKAIIAYKPDPEHAAFLPKITANSIKYVRCVSDDSEPDSIQPQICYRSLLNRVITHE